MTSWFPRKRVILAVHRWLGLVSALFLVLLSLTGLALNHTSLLGLDRIQLKTEWLLERYGMATKDALVSYRVDASKTLSHVDGSLYFNSSLIGEAGLPVGILEDDPIIIVASSSELLLLTPTGELVEILDTATLPFNEIQSLGKAASGEPVVIADGTAWQPDASWISFSSFGDSFTILPLRQIELEDESQEALLEIHQGRGISLYRVLLDLHSGRLFGWGGRTVMDLAAVAILVLVGSGISGWMRRRRRVPLRER